MGHLVSAVYAILVSNKVWEYNNRWTQYTGHLVLAVYSLYYHVCWSLIKCGDTMICGHNILDT